MGSQRVRYNCMTEQAHATWYLKTHISWKEGPPPKDLREPIKKSISHVLIKEHHQLCLQIYSSSPGLFPTPHRFLIVLSDCYFLQATGLLLTVRLLLPDMVRSSPGPFYPLLGPRDPTLSSWVPELTEWEQMSPLLLLLSLSFRGAPQSVFLGPISPGIF